MNCEEYRIAIHDYARGILSAADAARVEQHRRDCRHCDEFNAICAELPCTDFVEFLGEFVEERLSPDRRTIFERHLTVCPDCQNYLDSYRRTIRLGVEALREAENGPARDVPDDLIRAILNARRVGGSPDARD